MIVHINDKLCKNLAKGGSVLRGFRNTGGPAVGLMAGGICLLVFAVFVGGIFALGGIDGGTLFFTGLFGIPGILLLLFGNASRKRRYRDYLSYYKQTSGMDEEELSRVDQELASQDMLAVTYVMPGASKRHPSLGCFITPNYLAIPGVGGCYLRRIQDMVAAAYSEKIPGINGYQYGLVYISRHDQGTLKNAIFSKEECMEIIEELCRRNPTIIRDPVFVYEGKQYDLLKDGQEIIQLHKRVCGEA